MERSYKTNHKLALFPQQLLMQIPCQRVGYGEMRVCERVCEFFWGRLCISVNRESIYILYVEISVHVCVSVCVYPCVSAFVCRLAGGQQKPCNRKLLKCFAMENK